MLKKVHKNKSNWLFKLKIINNKIAKVHTIVKNVRQMIPSGQFKCLEECASFTLCFSGFSAGGGAQHKNLYDKKKINFDYSGIEH